MTLVIIYPPQILKSQQQKALCICLQGVSTKELVCEPFCGCLVCYPSEQVKSQLTYPTTPAAQLLYLPNYLIFPFSRPARLLNLPKYLICHSITKSQVVGWKMGRETRAACLNSSKDKDKDRMTQAACLNSSLIEMNALLRTSNNQLGPILSNDQVGIRCSNLTFTSDSLFLLFLF